MFKKSKQHYASPTDSLFMFKNVIVLLINVVYNNIMLPWAEVIGCVGNMQGVRIVFVLWPKCNSFAVLLNIHKKCQH